MEFPQDFDWLEEKRQEMAKLAQLNSEKNGSGAKRETDKEREAREKEHARLQASAQEARHATAQIEERLRTAHEQLQRVEASGQAQHRRAAKAAAAANVADAERAAAAAEKAAAERELKAVRVAHKADMNELRSTMSLSQSAEVDRLQGELLSLVFELNNADVLVFDGVDFHLVFVPFVEDRLYLVGDDDLA